MSNNENKKDEFLKAEATIHSTKQLMESPEVQALAKQVIEEHKMEFGPAEIGYFLIYPNLSKKRVAKCMKANREVKHYSGNDYLIEVSGEIWDMLGNFEKKMVLLHELLRIDPQFRSKTQEWKMKLRSPDFSDFYATNDKYGNEWYKTIQATAASLYDLDPRQESEVKL
ncbi:putative metallopeptidase [Gracilimonas tropica]|uniref:putative metallopeptidase n=1 Tax=Gracilimonas tropica TaxID=454600 RepID=UPI00035F7DC2|nr:putative metallopeptidase [Gracilimonas tropica]